MQHGFFFVFYYQYLDLEFQKSTIKVLREESQITTTCSIATCVTAFFLSVGMESILCSKFYLKMQLEEFTLSTLSVAKDIYQIRDKFH